MLRLCPRAGARFRPAFKSSKNWRWIEKPVDSGSHRFVKRLDQNSSGQRSLGAPHLACLSRDVGCRYTILTTSAFASFSKGVRSRLVESHVWRKRARCGAPRVRGSRRIQAPLRFYSVLVFAVANRTAPSRAASLSLVSDAPPEGFPKTITLADL
jgi:hypothetical protein